MEPRDESMEAGDESMEVGGAHFQQAWTRFRRKRTLPGLETASLRLRGMLFRERAKFFPSKSTPARPGAIPSGLVFSTFTPWECVCRTSCLRALVRGPFRQSSKSCSSRPKRDGIVRCGSSLSLCATSFRGKAPRIRGGRHRRVRGGSWGSPWGLHPARRGRRDCRGCLWGRRGRRGCCRAACRL